MGNGEHRASIAANKNSQWNGEGGKKTPCCRLGLKRGHKKIEREKHRAPDFLKKTGTPTSRGENEKNAAFEGGLKGTFPKAQQQKRERERVVKPPGLKKGKEMGSREMVITQG